MTGLEHKAKPATSRSFLRTIKMVGWSLLGIRKGSELEKDAAQVNPLHVIVVGVATIIVLVVGLIVLVNVVVAK
ncbi:MAG: DUF2970 domain-containing protein [Gammaproteobacteria bacterium]|uniref:DUF2970 domain-containing protein n=1 Tax=Rhodoferax sp. TaxID=50421 RepID=UPI0017C2395B|nr:DUF2970 domain-containing protein [Rhodoferax sp.]MBU3898638.1 DUF2970 domain-containing protein [Gammaproteobacteria bacterium]MBA3057045.1 DUF2970 domain-containing protein [Rhodoferax sp.]MBU3997741.1 DUF2970 domain-containing protein [Gammaproteobacteria bacterium]MBU4019547.1 DUF2970 domain-containing protein [Gammaproteobacteria bacterium]MBU4079061.1 DUF2970 domain-containing protein [Gammaproteobacteria bacterium]